MRSMGDVHRLILHHGVEQARTFAGTKLERNAIDAAAAVLADEEHIGSVVHQIVAVLVRLLVLREHAERRFRRRCVCPVRTGVPERDRAL